MRPEISAPLQNAVRETSLEYLMLETDGPYVKPIKPEDISNKSWEKARNTGLILPSVAKHVAELKRVTVEEVLKISEENTRRVFRIK